MNLRLLKLLLFLLTNLLCVLIFFNLYKISLSIKKIYFLIILLKNKLQKTIFLLNKKKIKNLNFKKIFKLKKNLNILYKYLNINSIFPIIISLLFLDSLTLMESDNNIHHYILKDNGDFEEVTNEEEKEKLEKEQKMDEEKMKQEKRDFNILLIILILLFGFFWFYFFNNNFFDNTSFDNDVDSNASGSYNKEEIKKPYVRRRPPGYNPYYPGSLPQRPYFTEVVEDYEKYLKSDEELKELQTEYKEVIKEKIKTRQKRESADILKKVTFKAHKDELKKLYAEAKEAALKKTAENGTEAEIAAAKKEILSNPERRANLKELKKKYMEKDEILKEAIKEENEVKKRYDPLDYLVRSAEYAKSIFLNIKDQEALEARERESIAREARERAEAMKGTKK